MGEVHKFNPKIVGERFRFDCDELLEEAKGQGFATLVILGELPDGQIWITGSANTGETLILMERVKRQVIE